MQSCKNDRSTGDRRPSFVPWPITQLQDATFKNIFSSTRNSDDRREVSLFSSVTHYTSTNGDDRLVPRPGTLLIPLSREYDVGII